MNRRGISLIEVVVASVLLGILVMGFMSLQKFLFKGTQTALNQGALVRALALMREDLLRDDRYLPPQEIPSTADPRDPSTLNGLLDDPETAGQKCYTRYGSEVTACLPAEQAFFKVRYAKFRQPDLSFYDTPTNEMNRIPLAFYRVRVEFSPDNGKTQKTIYFSQYATSVVIY